MTKRNFQDFFTEQQSCCKTIVSPTHEDNTLIDEDLLYNDELFNDEFCNNVLEFSPQKVRKTLSPKTIPEQSQEDLQKHVSFLPQPLVLKLLPSPKINQLDSFSWLNIVSFIGLEQFFYQKPYLINRNTCERMYNNPIFWEGLFQQLWNGNPKRLAEFNWEHKRSYCFSKYFDFKAQKQLNLHILMGQIATMPTNMIARRVENNIYNQCFVTSMDEPECYHLSILNGHLSKMDWNVTVYLKDCPVCLHLNLAHRTVFSVSKGMLEEEYLLEARIPHSDVRIKIFGQGVVVKRGIKKLFGLLGMSKELDLESDELDFRFYNLRFGPLMKDRYFIWFCNSVLSTVPFPIEDIYELSDRSVDLNFQVDDERNEKIAVYYKLKNDLGIQ